MSGPVGGPRSLLRRSRALGPRGRLLLAASATAAVAASIALVIAVAPGGSGRRPAASAAPPTTVTTATTAATTTTTTVAPTTTEAPPTSVSGAAPRPGSTTTSTKAPEPEPQPVPTRPPVRCAGTGSPTTGTLPGDSPQGPKRWVAVGTLAGSCDGTSAAFAVGGIDTRLVVRNDAASIDVFVVDVSLGRDATAGFSDLSCGGPCAETQTLVLPAGSYRLEVQADDGPWLVEVQEYR